MLKKLMKHEFRATGRIMLPLLLLVLLCAVGGNISAYNLLESGNSFLSMLGVVLLSAFFIAIMTSCAVSFVLMVQRFYRNLLRDEAYLTLTLPVCVHQHIWAKLLVSLLWWLAVALVSALAVFILVFRLEMFSWLAEILSQLSLDALPLHNLPHMLLFAVELALLMAVGGACLCLHFYAALSVGHSFTHHKDALSVVSFFVLPMLLTLMEKLVMLVLNLLPLDLLSSWLQGLSTPGSVHLTMLGVIVCTAIPSAIYYAVTAYFLKNRLNLG